MYPLGAVAEDMEANGHHEPNSGDDEPDNGDRSHRGKDHGGSRRRITPQSVEALVGGWPTTAARDYRSEESSEEFNLKRHEHPRGKPLSEMARLTGPNPSSGPVETVKPEECRPEGYPTPRTITGGGESAERKRELGREDSGGGDLWRFHDPG